MAVYALRRLLFAVPMLLGVSLAAFLLLHALPGDAARAILGQRATEENVREFREREGLNDPLPAQYGRFLSNLFRGELGRSHRTNRPVLDELKERMPATVELAVCAMALASIVGIALGILAAIRPRTLWDFLCLSLALVGVSMPIFWLGFLAQKGFSGALGWLPFGARLDVAKWPTFESHSGFFLLDAVFVYGSAELALDVIRHLVLPSAVLATVPMAIVARMTRANMIELLGKDFIRTARAKGLGTMRVVLRHAAPNALIPVITAIGAQFGYLLGGAVLTETIFGWPGLGTYVIESINVLDAKPLQASVMLVASLFIAINLITDLSYAVVDPRLRDQERVADSATGTTWRQFVFGAIVSLPWIMLAALSVFAGRRHMLWLISAGAVVVETAVALAIAVKTRPVGRAAAGFLEALAAGIQSTFLAARGLPRFLGHHRPAAIGAALILLMIVCAVGARWIAPYDPMQGFQNYNARADSQFWMGTDAQGRDLFSRLVWGARYTLLVALAATLLSLIAGTLLGVLAGFFGGAVDAALMRAVDFVMSFPSFLLAAVTVAVLGRSLENLIWAVGFVGIPLFARQMRAEVLRVKVFEFVDAARSLGAGQFRILARTVMPNCITPLIVLGTLGMGSAILDVAGLAFLGLGGDPFVPEWGLILKLGWDESAKGAFQVAVSGACILGTVLGFNLLGDGLRDWLDPRTRG